ncbi:peptidoglycan-binding domain-containing protein [Nesterenkonia ebinurensis]|uniref:peptidoglycan-binding domain-containing protein n=1 Tax=Nesterenkonia ebinurensis TaxID=2608252 RepID=UPI00123CD8A6|nr:peptidoglycan-binding domain-containing protein [Nesterenkonia ebinurensis]
MAEQRRRPRRRFLNIAVLVVAIVLAAAAGWWAGTATLGETEAESDEQVAEQGIWAAATHESVGRSLNLSTTVRQPSDPVGTNQFAGIVREANEGQLDNGDMAYRVGSTAVRIIESDGPFWRDLEPGNSGPDVTAVQEFLIDAGYLDSGEAPGSYDQWTASAVEDWQDDLGVAVTGTIPLGEVVAVPQSPIVIQLGEEIRIGAELAGGEESIQAPTGDRSFVMVLMDSQAQQVPMDAIIEITFEDHTWEAVVASVTEGDPQAGGGVEYDLTSPEGDEVCKEHCEELPADTQLSLRSSVVVTPPVEGVAVPAAAVRTSDAGATYVETREGETDVEVLGSGQGVAIIEGIEEGDEVRVFGEGGDTGQPQPEQQPGEEQDPELDELIENDDASPPEETDPEDESGEAED